MGFKSKLSQKDARKAEDELNEDPKLCFTQKLILIDQTKNEIPKRQETIK